jgi:hypothetical protein
VTRAAARNGRARAGAPVALVHNYGSVRGLLPIAVLPIPRRGPSHLLLENRVRDSTSVRDSVSVSVSDSAGGSVSVSDSASASASAGDSASASAGGSVSAGDSVSDVVYGV